MREPPGKSIMLVIAKRFFHDGRDIVVVKEAPIPFLAQLVFQFDDLPCGPQGGPFQSPPNSSAVSLDMPDIFLDQHLQFGFFLGFGVHAGHVFHQPPDGDALFLGHEQSNAPGVGLPVGGHLGKQDAGADRVQDQQKGVPLKKGLIPCCDDGSQGAGVDVTQDLPGSATGTRYQFADPADTPGLVEGFFQYIPQRTDGGLPG